MKRGELVEVTGANERLGIDDGVADLKQRLNFWMAEYNKYTDLLMPGLPSTKADAGRVEKISVMGDL